MSDELLSVREGREGGREGGGGGRRRADTELKTKKPHVNVGNKTFCYHASTKNVEQLCGLASRPYFIMTHPDLDNLVSGHFGWRRANVEIWDPNLRDSKYSCQAWLCLRHRKPEGDQRRSRPGQPRGILQI